MERDSLNWGPQHEKNVIVRQLAVSLCSATVERSSHVLEYEQRGCSAHTHTHTHTHTRTHAHTHTHTRTYTHTHAFKSCLQADCTIRCDFNRPNLEHVKVPQN